MGRWAIILARLGLVLLLLYLWAAWSFRRSAGDLVKELEQAPAPSGIRNDLPEEARDFALRGMAEAAPDWRVARLRQVVALVLKRDGPCLPIGTRQTIGLTGADFGCGAGLRVARRRHERGSAQVVVQPDLETL